EVGTGFHPELTGRENIYLNGAILGMSKAEIKAKEAEIIEFSGCERYVDTPVKRYSSGMRVRLAFAVAAHLEPDILVIDEVLAVGDAEFQKKAIGKMQDISRGDGRTVLFVSHNMAAVKSLCTRAIVLEHGSTVFEGDTDEAIDFYISKSIMNDKQPQHCNVKNIISNVDFQVIKGGGAILLGDQFSFDLSFDVLDDLKDLSISLDFLNHYDELICHVTNEDSGYYVSKVNNGNNLKINIQTDNILFIPGIYFINLWIGQSHTETLYKIKNVFVFQVEQGTYTQRTKELPKHAKLYLNTKWE
ncbi:MAG: ABC transporter ATP-binding protein, partial [Gelidibacter sp.]